MEKALEVLEELLDAKNFSGDLLTWEELASVLGVEKDAEGNIPTLKLMDACLRVTTNPQLLPMEREERIQVIATAAVAFSQLQGCRM